MEMIDHPYIVYVKTNSDGYITAVNSSAFLANSTGWWEIDRGHGNRYHHAQSAYFPETLWTDGGAYRYKLVDGQPVECTPEEIAEQDRSHTPESLTTQEERIQNLEAQNELMLQCILELSEVLNVQSTIPKNFHTK